MQEPINLGDLSGVAQFAADPDAAVSNDDLELLAESLSGGLICRGGDQTLFVKKEIFFALNGFSEKFIIMEDYDFVKRLMKIYSFKVIPEYAVVSARKYEHNSWAKVNFANAVAMYMFMSGAYSPQRIRNTYHSMIKNTKGQ